MFLNFLLYRVQIILVAFITIKLKKLTENNAVEQNAQNQTFTPAHFGCSNEQILQR